MVGFDACDVQQLMTLLLMSLLVDAHESFLGNEWKDEGVAHKLWRAIENVLQSGREVVSPLQSLDTRQRLADVTVFRHMKNIPAWMKACNPSYSLGSALATLQAPDGPPSFRILATWNAHGGQGISHHVPHPLESLPERASPLICCCPPGIKEGQNR
jgi:hypothetical protein